jgi:hypothetical protein
MYTPPPVRVTTGVRLTWPICMVLVPGMLTAEPIGDPSGATSCA